MAIHQIPQVDEFKRQLRTSLKHDTAGSRTIKVDRHGDVYKSGDQDDMVYFIDSGQIKLFKSSAEGKKCLLAFRGDGDIFGESSVSAPSARAETARAMKPSVVKQIPRVEFFKHLSGASLLEGFVGYLAMRIAEQQQVITNMVTIPSEHRLGHTLLQLARNLGKRDPNSVRIELAISQEELSHMVGTTRSRINMFMQRFHRFGLIETNEDHFLIIEEKKLARYLARNT